MKAEIKKVLDTTAAAVAATRSFLVARRDFLMGDAPAPSKDSAEVGAELFDTASEALKTVFAFSAGFNKERFEWAPKRETAGVELAKFVDEVAELLPLLEKLAANFEHAVTVAEDSAASDSWE